MQVSDVYVEMFGRIGPLVHAAADGMDPGALVASPQPGTNPVGWLLWHLTRVQDHHVSELLGTGQVWPEYARLFGLAPDPWNIGFAHKPADVAAVIPRDAQAVTSYYDAVHARTLPLLESLTPEELSRVVDENWDPPVTLGVRLVSVADDSLQHVGQALYVRGLVQPGWHLGY